MADFIRSAVRAICLAIVSGGLLAGSFQHGKAAEMPPSVKALIPAAKKEGTLIVFGRSMNPRQNAAFVAAAGKFYGFDFEMKLRGGSHNQKAAEVMQAVRNNVPTGIDIFWTSYNTSVRLENAGAFRKFDWAAAFGLPPEIRTDEYGLHSHDVSLALVTYNTNLVKSDQVPKTWDDLLNPRWKGRVAMPRTPTPWIYLTRALGEEKATRLLNGFVSQLDVKILPTFKDVTTRVASGEFAIGIGSDSFYEIRRGAPIAHAKLSPAPISPWGIYIVKDAKNPNRAKLFGYWLATEDGQKALRTIDVLARATTKGGELWKLTHDVETKVLTADFTEKNEKRLAKKYGDIMGIR